MLSRVLEAGWPPHDATCLQQLQGSPYQSDAFWPDDEAIHPCGVGRAALVGIDTERILLGFCRQRQNARNAFTETWWQVGALQKAPVRGCWYQFRTAIYHHRSLGTCFLARDSKHLHGWFLSCSCRVILDKKKRCNRLYRVTHWGARQTPQTRHFLPCCHSSLDNWNKNWSVSVESSDLCWCKAMACRRIFRWHAQLVDLYPPVVAMRVDSVLPDGSNVKQGTHSFAQTHLSHFGEVPGLQNY